MPEPTVHELKLKTRFFDAVASGAKPFEVRRDDRGFTVGDVLVLREYDPPYLGPHGYTMPEEYSGRTIHRTITFILRHEDYAGIAPGFVVLGLAKEGDGE